MMDPRFQALYQAELLHVRELAQEFSERFPKIAGRLGLGSAEVKDPYVERLLEGFSFSSARVQLKLQEEFPQFTEQVMELVYPGLQACRPAMGIVELCPQRSSGQRFEPFEVSQGTFLSARTPHTDTPIRFRTTQTVSCWPIGLECLEYGKNLPETSRRWSGPSIQSALRFQIRVFNVKALIQAQPESLTFFIAAEPETAFVVFELLQQSGLAMVVGKGIPRPVHIEWLGVESNDALLPMAPMGFDGFRIAQELLTMPRRALFFKLHGLKNLWGNADADGLVHFDLLFEQWRPDLAGKLNQDSLKLHCTPVINLFEHRCDPVPMAKDRHEHLVVVDRLNPTDYEVHSVIQVHGLTGGQSKSIPILSFFQPSAQHWADGQWVYSTRRTLRAVSTNGPHKRLRSGQVASETWISVHELNGKQRIEHSCGHLQIRAWVSNRDLPSLLQFGPQETHLHAEAGCPIEGARFLVGPTPSYPSLTNGASAWQLISHLSLNWMGLIQQSKPEALIQLLALLMPRQNGYGKNWLDAILHIEGQADEQLVFRQGRRVPARGIWVHLVVDESQLVGLSASVLGWIVLHVLARHVSLHSYVRLSVQCKTNAHTLNWPAWQGERPLL